MVQHPPNDRDRPASRGRRAAAGAGLAKELTGPRDLPSVDRLAAHSLLAASAAASGPVLAMDAARAVIDEARQSVLAGARAPSLDDLAEAAASRLREWTSARPRRVINATGVILHTNLGRAPLSQEAVDAMRVVAAGYSDLEYDAVEGQRGSRQAAVDELLRRVTGAQASFVVNNNAGATLLVLAALAGGRQALVSRGELVEIGGGFRLPEVFSASGAELVEVGTTNRTYAGDYRRVLEAGASRDAEGGGEAPVALILRVHPSNYRLSGFAHRPSLAELVTLARAFEVPLVDDVGSGALLDTARFGLASEPRVQDSLAGGADLVTFSGDKLLGGPQAGIVCGSAALIGRLKRHPLARALRPGKDVFAALNATLLAYLKGEAIERIPVWRMIAASPEALRLRADSWLEATQREAPDQTGAGARLEVVAGESTVGGGSLPGETLPSWNLALAVRDADALAAALRAAHPPVVARIESGRVLLDPRTVLPEEDAPVVAALRGVLAAI